jgi:hypothetical protein
MADLITARNLAEHDDFYARLLAAHRGLTETQSHEFNARLIMILANHIGAPKVLAQALALASQDAHSSAK